MMKKRVMSMLMVMIMMVSMLSVSVFADEPCTHDWMNDSDVAMCKLCSEKHTHTLAYDYDESGHWQICSDAACPVEAKYNEAIHTLVLNAEGNKNVCECGYEEHVHVWATTLSKDDTNHWYECTASGCTSPAATKDVVPHTWVKQDTGVATSNDYVCSCGATKSEHVHVWETSYTYDDNTHWYKCIACDEKGSEAKHYDYNGTGICDAGDCNAPVANTLTTLTISGLSVPAEGVGVDFSVNVAESCYLDTKVNWNKVTNLKTNASVALGETATFAAGEMYNTGILVRINTTDTVSENLAVTLDGVEVPFYKSKASFDAAQKTYEGTNTVYMAREYWPANGQRYIMVCAMYAKLGGTHTHNYGSDWVETPAKHYYLCSGCGETKDTEFHYDNNKSGLCDVCGFDMKYFNKNATASNAGTGTAGHTHSYSTDWVEDISNHWKQCTGCGAKTQQAAHADLNNTGKCDVCGFVMTAAAGHTHTFSADWTETFAQHYKVCECGAKNEIAAHADQNKTGKCDVCGYAMTTLSNNGIVADTGDDNATFLWMAAFAIAVMGFGATVVVARKKREE